MEKSIENFTSDDSKIAILENKLEDNKFSYKYIKKFDCVKDGNIWKCCLEYNSYKDNKYWTCKERIKICTFIETKDINNKGVFYKESNLLVKVKDVSIYGEFCKILYETGEIDIFLKDDIQIKNLTFQTQKCLETIDYFFEIWNKKEVKQEIKWLINKIKMINIDSVAFSYLTKNGNIKVNEFDVNDIIFPFNFNESQFNAVSNAMKNSLSFVQGPPGTGKTQTILNIVANLILKNKTVAIISNNNSAIKNVNNKLEEEKYSFFTALLGNAENKENFKNNDHPIPDMLNWDIGTITPSKENIIKTFPIVLKCFKIENEKANLVNQKYNLEKEYEYFKYYFGNELNESLKIQKIFSNEINIKKLSDFRNEVLFIVNNNKKAISKTFLLLKYKLKLNTFKKLNINQILLQCDDLFYKLKIKYMNNKINEFTRYLENNKFTQKIESIKTYSKKIFERHLFNRFNKFKQNPFDLKMINESNKKSFLNRFPVILSSTYSIKTSIHESVIYDYVIYDESTQVNIVTALLGLSSAKNVIVVGDTKQLKSFVENHIISEINEIMDKYDKKDEYNFIEENFLSLITKMFPNTKNVLLKEHYRCHPDIINYCNLKYYNNELVCLTKSKDELSIDNCNHLDSYEVKANSDTSNNKNIEQINKINEIIETLNIDNIAIITPFNNQIKIGKQYLNNKEEIVDNEFVYSKNKIDIATVDKFQGQEQQVAIYSTVKDDNSFVANSNRLNVSISRAKDKFILVSNENDSDKYSIYELLKYIEYHKNINNNILNNFYTWKVDDVRFIPSMLIENIKNSKINYFKKKLNKKGILKFKNIIEKIEEIISEYCYLDYSIDIPLSYLCNSETFSKDLELTKTIEIVIFSKISKLPILIMKIDELSFLIKNDNTKSMDGLYCGKKTDSLSLAELNDKSIKCIKEQLKQTLDDDSIK